MGDVSIRIVIIRSIRATIPVAIALPFFAVMSLSAQSDLPVNPEPDLGAAVTLIENSNPGIENSNPGSQNSITLPRQHSLTQGVELVRRLIDQKDYFSAWPLAVQILAEPNAFVPTRTTTEVATHAEVRRLLATIPAEIRQQIDETEQFAAKRVWEKSRTEGPDQIARFADNFVDSPTATNAWWAMGCSLRDRGKPRHAAAAFKRSAQHPKATSLQRAIGLFACLESLLDSKQESEARAIRQELMTLDLQLPLQMQGRSLTLGQWLAEPRLAAPPSANDQIQADALPRKRVPAAEDWRRQRPVLLPNWKQEFSSVLKGSLEVVEQKQRDQSINSFPIVEPMIIGPRVIVRTLDEIRAFAIDTGKPLWSIPNTEYGMLGKRSIENSGLQPLVIDWAQRRTVCDSIFGGMATNGSQLFAIQEPDRAGELRINQLTPRGTTRNGPRFNQLCCYSVETGALQWEAGEAPADNGGTFAGTVFLGPPLIVDDRLYVIAQHRTEMALVSLSAGRGELLASLSLGTARLPIDEDLQRSRVACPLLWYNGLLLCSTSAGAVVAVDPLLQTWKWAYRYPATTISAGDLAPTPIRNSGQLQAEPWWELWREPFAQIVSLESNAVDRRDPAATHAGPESVLVFASPETPSLHAIQLPDGQPLWQVPRSGGLLVAGIDSQEQSVIVLEGDAVRSHDLRSGKQLWRTITGEASGPAVLSGAVIVLPVRSGGTTLLDAQNGQILSETTSADAPLGVLAGTEQGWIAFQRQSIMLLPKLADVRRQIEIELQGDPNNESLRVRAALLDLQAGEVELARERVAGLNSSPAARNLKRLALTTALVKPAAEESSLTRTDLARELMELADNADYKFAAAAAIGTSAMAENDFVAAVDSALTGLAADFDPDDSLVKRAAVSVRKDRVLLGIIEEAALRAKLDDQSAIQELFRTRLNLARKSRDRFAVQQLAQQWRGLDWGRQLLISDEEKVLRKRSFIELELRLLDAAGSADKTTGVESLDRLALRFDRLGLDRDARETRLRILHEFSQARYADGQLATDRMHSDPTVSQSLKQPQPSAWPAEEPKVDDPRNDRNFGVYCQSIPVHAEPESLAARLDIAIDRTGSDVLFRGESFFQSGQDEDHEQKFSLPRTMSLFRGPAGHMLREAWGVGRIVILRVGSELFAIAPLNDQGEPQSKLLWANPIEMRLSSGTTKTIPPRRGIHHERQRVVDELNRPVGKVGPVRASYLCYQSGNRLVTVDTETGRVLWERSDVPADATVLGDDHGVYVWRTDKTIEKLSPIDGRKLVVRDIQGSPETLIHDRGSLAWTALRTDQNLLVELQDLKTGEVLWSRSDPLNTMVAVLDTETLAIVTPDGKLNLLAARTAAPLCSPLEVNAESMTGIVAWHDAERWYVGLSRTIQNLSGLKKLQPNEGYRLAFVNGPLYAIGRNQPGIVWKRDLNHEPISLDQSRAAPVLIQLWKLAAKGANNASEGMLRMIDKRTGKVSFEQSSVDILPYYLLNPDPQQSILELKLTQQTIRLRYAIDEAQK